MDQMPDIKDGQTNDCKDRESLVMALVTLLPFMSGRRRSKNRSSASFFLFWKEERKGPY